MKISCFIEAELDFYRQQCNFVNKEADVFELRSKGATLQEIADLLGFTIDGVKKVSQKVNNKINRVNRTF
jgi:transcriptional regulator